MDARILAEHFEHGERSAEAAAAYLRAGGQSFDRNDLEGALASAERGIGCGAEGEVRGGLFALVAMACCWRSELGPAHRAAQAALPLVAPGSRWACLLLFHAAWAALVEEKEEAFNAAAARFTAFSPDPSARRDYLIWAPLAASLLTSYGHRDLCRALLDRAEALAATLPSIDLDVRGALAVGQSDYVRAFERDPRRQLELTRAAVAAFDAIGDARNMSTARCRLGQALDEIGEPQAGEEVLRRAVDQAKGIPFSRRQAELHLAALLARGAGEAGWAEAEGIALAVLAGEGVSAGYRGWAHGLLAQIALGRGAFEEAVARAREAEALCARLPHRRIWVEVLLVTALARSGRREEARPVGRSIEDALARLGGGYVEIEARRALAEAGLTG
jgi:hypothetical protein